jgi:predicted NBD/HSP70 family sugar kinase
MKHWGIDLGGTKTEIAVVDRGRAVIRRRVPTKAGEGYESVLDNIRHLVRETGLELGSTPETIGLATPGSPDPSTGLLRNSNTTCLNGKALSRDLSEILEAEVVVSNDANCFALAEARWGVGREDTSLESILGLIIGTGVGAGLVVNGELLVGANGNAGEWGHNQLEEDGIVCYCGQKGCVETVISGPALERYYNSRSGTPRVLSEIVGRTDTDAAAEATVERLLLYFGEAIATVINILDPQVIVVGGGVGNVPQLYERWPDYAIDKFFNGNAQTTNTRLVRPLLGDSAGVFGAAGLTGEFELEVF